MLWETKEDWPEIEGALQSAAHPIQDAEAFEDWTRDKLRVVFPHGWLLVILGDYSDLGAMPTNCLSVDFPLQYIERLKTIHGYIESPLIKRWFASLKPQVYEAQGLTQWPEAGPAWIHNATRYKIQNAIAHGRLYPQTQRFAYINIVQIPGGITPSHVDFLERFTPLICDAATLALAAQPKQEAASAIVLTEREKQILHLAARGKTDKTIAKELNIAFGTVRTHLERAGKKLGTSKRAEMVLLAMTGRPSMYPTFRARIDTTAA